MLNAQKAQATVAAAATNTQKSQTTQISTLETNNPKGAERGNGNDDDEEEATSNVSPAALNNGDTSSRSMDDTKKKSILPRQSIRSKGGHYCRRVLAKKTLLLLQRLVCILQNPKNERTGPLALPETSWNKQSMNGTNEWVGL
jgi:hypothetical protein